MLFLIRFTYIALLLILAQLIIPAFRAGGRFIILVIAMATAFSAQLIRRVISGRLLKNRQVFLCSVSIIIILLLSGYHFSGVKPTFLGILATYLGLVLLEMLLPDDWYELVYQKYQRPE